MRIISDRKIFKGGLLEVKQQDLAGFIVSAGKQVSKMKML